MIDITLLGFLVSVAIAVARTEDLFAATMLTGIYSLLSAGFFVVMDAVDVAFTEAAVGAGISTLLMLTTLKLTGQYESPNRPLQRIALVVITVTAALLFYGFVDMPTFGDPSAPIHQHVAPRYIQQSSEEVGMPNIVTSVLASYRSYDTFGETVVIFTAGIGVLALLSYVRSREEESQAAIAPMLSHTILRIVSKILIPPILLFALYVQFHGDYGPGGGFQAGVIFAAAIILYAMIFGLDVALKVVNLSVIQFLAALGVLIYASVGIVSLLSGHSFLDYNVLADDAIHGQHWGILIVELGVGITVASVMLVIFFNFSSRVDKNQDNHS